jgi:hypothetical protein
MKNIREDLHLRLQSKGFTPNEIHGIIDEVLKFLGNGKHRTRSALNRELEDLGWGIEIIDPATYKLTNTIKSLDRLIGFERLDVS